VAIKGSPSGSPVGIAKGSYKINLFEE
jgi:hypothetical protein